MGGQKERASSFESNATDITVAAGHNNKIERENSVLNISLASVRFSPKKKGKIIEVDPD